MTYTFTLRGLVVGICWTIGAVIAVLDWVLVPNLAAVSIAFVGLAVMMSIRGCIAKFAADWTMAYEMGRGVSESENKVRQIR